MTISILSTNSRHGILKMLSTITCVWLFYFLSGMMQVGLIKVEVHAANRDHKIVDDKFSNNDVLHGFWAVNADNFYTIYATRTNERNPRDVTGQQRQSGLVIRFKITRGFRTFFPDSTVGYCQVVEVIHSLVSSLMIAIFIINVGSYMKYYQDKLMLRGVLIDNHQSTTTKLNSFAASLLFLLLGIIMCIPLRYLYLSGLRDQEKGMIESIGRAVETVDITYLWRFNFLLAFYFSVLNIGVLLSFSHWFAMIIHILLHSKYDNPPDTSEFKYFKTAEDSWYNTTRSLTYEQSKYSISQADLLAEGDKPLTFINV